MSDASDRAERRRWLTVAELVAVAGVVIAGLTWYTGWSDRRADEDARRSAATSTARERARIDLKATVADDGRTLTLADPRHDLQDLVVTFPRALGVSPQRPVETAIDADWFADKLLALTDGGTDERTGRLPVLLGVRFWDGDASRTASGLYDVVWRTEGRILRGRTLRLEGLRLRERGGDQARLDAAWAREKP